MNKWKEKTIQLAYLLSISLFISGIIYFFASNWGGFEKATKISISVGLIILFYVTSLLLKKVVTSQPFLSRWFLVLGSISFGVCIALVGQIYNSHADSYMLYWIWFVPVVLFGIVTKYEPFYIFSFLLLHLGIGFYLFPTSVTIHRSMPEQFFILLLFSGLNLALYFLSRLKPISSKSIEHLSLLGIQLFLLPATFIEVFNGYSVIGNILYLVFCLYGYLQFYQKDKAVAKLVVMSIGAVVYSLIKFIDLLIFIDFGGEAVILLGFLIVGALIAGSIKLVNRISGSGNEQNVKWKHTIKQLIIVTITVISSVIGLITIMVFFFMMFNIGHEIEWLNFIALLFVLTGIKGKIKHDQIRYTLVSIGLLLGSGTSIFLAQDFGDSVNLWPSFFFIALFIYSWRFLPKGLKTLSFLLGNLVLYSLIEYIITGVHDEVFMISGILAVVSVLCYYVMKDSYFKHHVYSSGLIYFFVMTFVEPYGFIPYVIFNGLFLALTTVLLFKKRNENRKYEFVFTITIWFAFLAFKYYDFAWDLLHKSVLLIGLGLLFYIATASYEKKIRQSTTEPSSSSIINKTAVIAIIVLQFVLIGVQVTKSEIILRQGETVKLELRPVDPRAMLQGDYVRLNYEISRIDDVKHFQDLSIGDKVQVILRENENGIFQYGGYVQYKGEWNKPYTRQQGDVIINGNVTSSYMRGVQYGIETFFVHEGEGIDLQNNADIAIVKIATNGDALLIDVVEE